MRALISGISHITFIVQDLEKSSYFLKTIFKAKEAYSSGEKTFSISKEMFFLVGDLWICISVTNIAWDCISTSDNNALDYFIGRTMVHE